MPNSLPSNQDLHSLAASADFDRIAAAGVYLSSLQSILAGRHDFWYRAGKTHRKTDGTYARDTFDTLGYPDALEYRDYREQSNRAGS